MATLILLVALGVAIAIHELGHLIGGWLLGLRASRIRLGMGPTLVRVDRAKVRLVVGAIPLGAAVDIDGMNPHAEQVASSTRRLGVLICGPVANFLVAFLVLLGLYRTGTHVPVSMTIGAVITGSEAARAQLRPGDVVESVDAYLPRGWTDLVRYLEDHPNTPVQLVVRHGATGTPETITVRPAAGADGRGRIGIRQQYVYKALPWMGALRMAGQHEARLVSQAFRLGLSLVSRRSEAIFTPTGHVHSLSEEAASGWDAFLRVVVALSVGLGLLHLLPLPSLDGSRILLTFFEATTGKRVPVRLETTVHAMGFVAFVVLIALVAVRDLEQVLRIAAG